MGHGIIHEKKGVPCQDWLVCESLANGNCIAALSDGAGSAKYAEQASKLTLASVVNLFSEMPLGAFISLPEHNQKVMVIECVLKDIISNAKDNGCSDLSQYSATLLFAVWNDSDIVFFHIGDGSIIVTSKSNDILYLSSPDNIENNSYRTHFCVSTDAHLYVDLKCLSLSDFSNVLMTSDGAYSMLSNRSDGCPELSMIELISYHQNNNISTNEEFADVLNQMAESPSERFDDWSIIMLKKDVLSYQGEIKTISMLEEEKRKYAPHIEAY